MSHEAPYFNCDEIDENVVLSFGPIPYTVAMIASAMPLAIRLYSMAVAPDSSPELAKLCEHRGRVSYSRKASVK